jgi:hypothetical protein
MNRQTRFENAYNAVATALLTGATYTGAELLAIAYAQLSERSAFLATNAVARCIQDSEGNIGPDIMMGGTCDGDESTFTFTYIGG